MLTFQIYSTTDKQATIWTFLNTPTRTALPKKKFPPGKKNNLYL
jgi:hypothetical protein